MIIEQFLKLTGLYEKIFWTQILEQIIRDEEDKKLLEILEVMGFDDVYIFSKKFDYKKFKEISEIIFKFKALEKEKDETSK